jgi:hypothetical protein
MSWLCGTFVTRLRDHGVVTRYPVISPTGYLVITSELFSSPSRRSFR